MKESKFLYIFSISIKRYLLVIDFEIDIESVQHSCALEASHHILHHGHVVVALP
jgi:hypothetical protein